MAKKDKQNFYGLMEVILISLIASGYGLYLIVASVLIFIAWRIESPQYPEIAEIFLSSRFYSSLGWLLWVITIVVSKKLFDFHKATYMNEIDRLIGERNKLQEHIAGPHFQSSIQSLPNREEECHD